MMETPGRAPDPDDAGREPPRPRAGARWPWILTLVLATWLVFVLDTDRGLGGALASGFVFDDVHLIVENEQLDHASGAFGGFTGDYYASSVRDVSGESRALGYYRPVAVFSNWLDHAIWRDRPFGYHLTNLVLHSAVVVLFFLLTDRLTRRRPLAFGAALLFAVHPIHVESVTFISGRVDVLAAAFYLLSLLFFVRTLDRPRAARPLALSLLFFLFALLSKEMAITLPAAVVLIAWLHRYLQGDATPDGLARRGVAALVRLVPYLAVVGVYLAVRLAAIGELTSRASAARDAGETVRQMAVVLSTYLGYLVWPPFGFNAEPNVWIPMLFDARVGLRLAIVGVVTLVALATLLPPVRRRVPAVALGLLWMLAALVPVSHILPIETLVGERFLYIPSLGAMLALSALVALAFGRGGEPRGTAQRAMLVAIVAVAVAYGASTVHRNGFWKDNQTFWTAKATLTPGAESFTALGVEYGLAGKMAEASRAYDEALKLDPDHVVALNNYALILIESGLIQESLQLSTRAVNVNARFAEGYNTAANAFHALGYFPQAVGQYKRALRLRPDYREAWVNLGNSYYAAGVPDSAIRAYDEAVALAPDRDVAIQGARARALVGQTPAGMDFLVSQGVVQPETSEAYIMQGMLDALTGYGDAAVASMLRATELDPTSVEAWLELGQLCDLTGRSREARAAFERAASLAPDLPMVHNNFGVFERKAGNLSAALEHFNRAVTVAPEDPDVLTNLGAALIDAGNVGMAADVLNRAVEAGGNAMTFFYRGSLRQDRGALTPAMNDYKAALARNPRLAEAHFRLGTLYALSERPEDAVRAYDSFLRFSPRTDERRPDVLEVLEGLRAKPEAGQP